jgi:hypothetical protein
MIVTKEYLESLNPCKDRFDHYLNHYSNWQGTLEEFLDLSELTHDDKKWVFVRSIEKDRLRLVAADFAERVLHIYESKYPNDYRPRKAIEAARSGSKYAAAYAAAAYAAAAYVAAYAADAAAYAAAHAAHAAADAAYAYAAAYAAETAAYAARAACRKDEDQAQIEIMKRYAREQQ